MNEQPLMDAALTRRVLALLGCPPGPPTLRRLNRLIRAYTRAVPWESASRIARRNATAQAAACARGPAAFWNDAVARGTGGTCFESNGAFWMLLNTLGYRSSLTINDMGQQRACHTAIIAAIDGSEYLVDVGIPLHCAVPLNPRAPTRRRAAFHTYVARPTTPQRFEIERTRHPKRTIYTLHTYAVPATAYAAAIEQDYGPEGLFLDRVIITKVVDERVWRFSSAEQPYTLEAFSPTVKQTLPLPSDPSGALAAHFGMDETIIATALAAVQP